MWQQTKVPEHCVVVRSSPALTRVLGIMGRRKVTRLREMGVCLGVLQELTGCPHLLLEDLGQRGTVRELDETHHVGDSPLKRVAV